MTRPDLGVIVRQPGLLPADRSLGPYHLEPLIQRNEQGELTAWHVRLDPGAITPISYHTRAEEAYYVIAGSGIAHLDGVDHPLHAGLFLRLPPGTRHAFSAGDQGLTLLDIHTPGCWPDHDTTLEPR
jgi:quercetin dioxygenase-like cupin family protein